MRPGYPLGIAVRPKPMEPLTGLFQRLNSIIPEDQQLVVLSSDTSVQTALQIMKEQGFSQIPIKAGKEIIGVFSYRSFALGTLGFKDDRTNVLKLTVADFLEDLPFKSVNDNFDDVIDVLEEKDAVLVGNAISLVAIVTTMDVLRYLYGVTSPYVVVAEVELAVRALMSWSANTAQLEECIKRSLSNLYRPDKLPRTADDLTFSEYASVIGHGDNWGLHFETAFGSSRANVRAKLERVAQLRNQLFHFRREVTVAEFEEITQVRDWLVRRTKLTQNQQPNARLEIA